MINSNETPKFDIKNAETADVQLDIPEAVSKLSDLRFIEDEIFLSMNPDARISDDIYAIWSCRPNIDDILRPRGFNDTISNIRIARMDNPFERLTSCNERGLQFITTPPSHSRLVSPAFLQSQHEGIVVTADVKGANTGLDTKLQYEVWYSKLPKSSIEKWVSNSFGNICRYVARDIHQEAEIQNYPRLAQIRRVGTAGVLGSSMSVTRSGPKH